jgi:regulator of RNase E activity RraA
VLKPADHHIVSFGTRSNAFGGWVIIDINQPMCLPGHLTYAGAPGDFIVGGNDGVQLIPAKLVDEVLPRVAETFARENGQRVHIAAGMPIDEV